MNSSKTKIFLTYFAAALVSLAVMVTIDYSLGDEAEFLNAWIIINKLFGTGSHMSDSFVIRKFGLIPAAIIMIVANFLIGALLVQLFKFIRNITLKFKNNTNA
ncbi:MAG: hypothetical protein KDC73_07635 [Ignavibacteriae bacterium]|nr:hypothetical protein [Ignavibacteriota bacterium]MCB9244498.1 hypothetical protein [Ignavibacteriales bacterium]